MPVGDRAAGLVGPAFVVLTNRGNGAAGRRHRDAVRSDARMCSPDFASRAANDAIGWIAGVLGFYKLTYYRYFHACHHRYTQDPARDPELLYPKARNRIEYFKEITGFIF